ncbi:AhpD-like protein [Durotheca rogersii]|uniref:AhpD-like protein n=1 Tax=Durotheca rogersii TaxID=419775 RepID=UPI00221EFF86|nr:AhpD-like protein [Durotheca rogersii]KAI5856764.1 AhpD-like protein [Durotheca rogersii]
MSANDNSSTAAAGAPAQDINYTVRYPNQRAVFPYIDPKKAPAELAQALKVLPFERNVLKLLAHAEGFFPPISQLLGTIFRITRELPTLEWQLVVLRTAALIGAHYVFEINTPVALVNGMPNAKRLLIAFGKVDDTEFFTVRDRILLRYVKELVEDNTASDGLLEELRANFTTREIIEVIVIVGLYTIFGRVANVSRIDEDPEIPGLLDSLTKLTGQKDRGE